MFIKKFVILCVFSFSFLFSNEFDDIFGESKSVKIKENQKMQSDDFMDSMQSAENHNKQKMMKENIKENKERK